MKKDYVKILLESLLVILITCFILLSIYVITKGDERWDRAIEKIESPMEGTINLSAELIDTNKPIAPGITRTGKITLYSGAGLAITNDEPKIVIHPAAILYQDTNGYLLKVKILNTNLIQVKTLIKIPEMEKGYYVE